MSDKTELYEAPASATLKFKSKNGFEYLFTLRETTGTVLLDKLEKLEADLLSRGGTPVAQNSYGNKGAQAPAVTKPCPIHKENMKQKTSKAGKTYFSHSRGVYPNLVWCNGAGFPEELDRGDFDGEGGY